VRIRYAEPVGQLSSEATPRSIKAFASSIVVAGITIAARDDES
jgi:hypothetical protein